MTDGALIVIGASAGGLEALEALVSGLPSDLPAAMGALLARLVTERIPAATRPAASMEAPMEGIYSLEKPSALTCPDCGGALRETKVDTLPYFTCHIGHRYGADSMEEAQLHMVEQAFEVALRALSERAALCLRLAETAQGMGQALSAKRWGEAGREARERAEVLIRFLGEEWIRPSIHPGSGGAPDRF